MGLAESVIGGFSPEVTPQIRAAHNVGARGFGSVPGVGGGRRKMNVSSVVEVVVENGVASARVEVDSILGVARDGVALQGVLGGRVEVDSNGVPRGGIVSRVLLLLEASSQIPFQLPEAVLPCRVFSLEDSR